MKTLISVAGLWLLASSSTLAQDPAPEDGHGPASREGFSHQFSRRAHTPTGVQLSFHYGLLQPILLGGFNAAVDVRVGRFVATVSHGAELTLPGDELSQAEADAGFETRLPWSTGFGLGITLVDELYVLADFKVHSVELQHDSGRLDYYTITVGLEIGYRLFLWRGLHIAPVLRVWPNAWSSIDRDGTAVGSAGLTHEPIKQGIGGFFANVLIGWAFDVH